MADGKVTINLHPVEYRLWRNEMELHLEALQQKAKEKTTSIAAKGGLRKRHDALKAILDKV